MMSLWRPYPSFNRMGIPCLAAASSSMDRVFLTGCFSLMLVAMTGVAAAGMLLQPAWALPLWA